MIKFRYTPPKNIKISDDEILIDLKNVSEIIETKKLTQKLYKQYGKYDSSTVVNKFGSWNIALKKIGLESGNINNYTDDELFENILNIWQYKGKQPTRKDLSFQPSKISQSPYNRRFNSWSEALIKFVKYINETDILAIDEFKKNKDDKKIGRDPSLRLRFKVLQRDNFSCVFCGASPAKDQNVILNIDHIIPWSAGGETTITNLQTLCQKCNLGKNNSLPNK